MDILTGLPRLTPSSIGVLPGSFHPPTRAHTALGEAALAKVDIVLFTMPRTFPHKNYEGVGLEERISLLLAATGHEPRFFVAVSEGGLFIEMAREARARFPAAGLPWMVCGRDAAERIVGWNYGPVDHIDAQLREYGLLVAARQGSYAAPSTLSDRIRELSMPPDWDAVSATEVRRRIAAGQDWRELVPDAIQEAVERLYVPARTGEATA
jgi:nicotinic acid mononucleotide adenylyltransferase